MSLPGPLELKALLRVDTDAEDVLLADLVEQATAAVQALLDRPITAASQTFYDVDAREGAQTLRVPTTPCVRSGAGMPVVTDVDGTAITGFRVNPRTGVLTVTADSTADFGNGPFTIVATVGLSARSDYATAVEPVLARAILDLASDWYQRRNAGATMEGEGGGVLTQYAQNLGIPPRIKDTVALFARVPL
jgi:hypothetical protein